MNAHSKITPSTGWTTAQVSKAWRIFNQCLPVIAEGVGVPPDELRALLVDGWEPPKPKPPLVVAPADDDLSYQAADDAFLATADKNDRFRLRDEHGEYLHMAVANNLRTREHIYAWRGSRSQLRAVRQKYPFARRLQIVIDSNAGAAKRVYR